MFSLLQISASVLLFTVAISSCVSGRKLCRAGQTEEEPCSIFATKIFSGQEQQRLAHWHNEELLLTHLRSQLESVTDAGAFVEILNHPEWHSEDRFLHEKLPRFNLDEIYSQNVKNWVQVELWGISPNLQSPRDTDTFASQRGRINAMMFLEGGLDYKISLIKKILDLQERDLHLGNLKFTALKLKQLGIAIDDKQRSAYHRLSGDDASAQAWWTENVEAL